MTSERQQLFILREDLLRPEHPSARCHAGCKSTNPGRSPGFKLRSFKTAPDKDTSENAIYTVARPRGNLTRFPILPASAQGTRTKSKRVALGFPNLTCQQQTRQSFALSESLSPKLIILTPRASKPKSHCSTSRHSSFPPSPFPFNLNFFGVRFTFNTFPLIITFHFN
jgi:hypothetical protein